MTQEGAVRPPAPTTREALSRAVLRVEADDRACDVSGHADALCPTHYAVFEGDACLGVVAATEVALSSRQRIFADLLPRPRRSAISASRVVTEALQSMDRHRCDALVVETETGGYVGVVTRESVVAALLEHQRSWAAALDAERGNAVDASISLLETLHENEANYRAILENAQEGIFQSTVEGRYLMVNPAMASIFGYASPDEMIGAILDIATQVYVRADERHRLRDALLATGAVRAFEFEARRKDGTHIWLRGSARTVRSRHGAPETYFEGVVQDITQQKRAAQESRLLVNVTKVLSEAPDFDVALSLSLWMICESTGWDYGEVWIPTPEGDRVVLGEPNYCREQEVESFRVVSAGYRFAPGVGLPGRVWEARRSCWIPDVSTDINFPRAAFARQVGIRAATGIPILADGSVVVVMSFFLREVRAEDARWVELVSSVAAQLGSLFLRRRANDDLVQRNEELETISRLSATLRLARDRDGMLPIILDAAISAARAEAGALLLVEDDVLRVAAVSGVTSRLGGRKVMRGEDPLWQMVRSGQSMEIRDTTQNSDVTQWPICRDLMWSLRACYCLPLRADEKVVGILHVGMTSPRPTGVACPRTLGSIAEMGGSALHRAHLFEKARRNAAELSRAYEATVEGWALALELRDRETEGHTRRVTDLTVRLARASGIGGDALMHIRRGALLHDIGKLGVPDHILLKTSALTPEEWEVMRRHPEWGRDLLQGIEFLRPAIDIPYAHHEKWDGSGYPRGLSGEAIPFGARLFAVVDIWDALRSDRPYRAAWTRERVLEHVTALSGTHLDPDVVELFLRVIAEPETNAL